MRTLFCDQGQVTPKLIALCDRVSNRSTILRLPKLYVYDDEWGTTQATDYAKR